MMRKHCAAAVAMIAAIFSGCFSASAADDREGQPIVYNSTRSAVERIMKRAVPRLQYDASMPADSLGAWREAMSEAMSRLMRHPDAPAAAPRKMAEARRDGYVIERWEAFPLDENPVAF
ncbi:MAG: alpha/beta hydrolase family protein, partial [Paramuribaculum sp.]|nr:alpha/beta hydrolase family protein [Paramuribaculum sp.]